MQTYQTKRRVTSPVISINEVIGPFLEDVQAAEKRFVACALHNCRIANDAAAACHLTSSSFTSYAWRELFNAIICAAQEGKTELNMVLLAELNKCNGLMWGINSAELSALFYTEWNKELLPTLALRVAEFSRRVETVMMYNAASVALMKKPNIPDVADAARAESASEVRVIVPTHLGRIRKGRV